MSEQVVNFCNALLSGIGILFGFSLASYVTVYLRYLKILVSRFDGKKLSSKEKSVKKSKFFLLGMLLEMLGILNGFLLPCIVNVYKVLAYDTTSANLRLIKQLLLSTRVFFIAYFGIVVVMVLLPYISFFCIRYSLL